MDKHEAAKTKWMIKSFYSDDIFMAISVLVLFEISNIKATLKMPPIDMSHLTMNEVLSIKDRAYRRLLDTSNSKKILHKFLDSLKPRRDDILEEVLKKYGLDKISDSTKYHDIMVPLFNESIEQIKGIISKGEWASLYRGS